MYHCLVLFSCTTKEEVFIIQLLLCLIVTLLNNYFQYNINFNSQHTVIVYIDNCLQSVKFVFSDYLLMITFDGCISTCNKQVFCFYVPGNKPACSRLLVSICSLNNSYQMLLARKLSGFVGNDSYK